MLANLSGLHNGDTEGGAKGVAVAIVGGGHPIAVESAVVNPGVGGVVTCIKLSVARTTAQQAVSGANGVVTADLMVRSPFYTRKVYTDPSGIVYPFCNAFPVLSGICHDVTF